MDIVDQLMAASAQIAKYIRKITMHRIIRKIKMHRNVC